ncbi:hypothetical protein H109_02473 [Trichophyton interdigitale MR816]|uniref:Uncharacterized protein n=1 Tax=Trichophyton interdigitale (strain MR816) TaxID=1215338 RepID=A0A059JCV2_TRIIM|nr:hypothetical protein H101_04778 [Trichophyton interdigitale H6]KDB25686.1 hypothetical protein H109_02473 [Trichophyton interdigitale MR816]
MPMPDLAASSSNKTKGRPTQRKPLRSGSWSAWLSGSVFRNIDTQGEPISNADGTNNDAATTTSPNVEMAISKNENHSIKYKKCSAGEEPVEEAGAGTESDAHSDAGTVRRPRIPSGNTPPKFILPPGTLGDHRLRPSFHNDAHPSHRDDMLERHRPHHSDRQRLSAGFLPSGPRRTSQTVSRDDFLTVRGANPRTGVISPDLTDDSHSDDVDPQIENSGGTMNNQKWRLKGDQWISLDASERTPVPTPSSDAGMNSSLLISSRDQAEAHVAFLSDAGVPLKNLEDRFVVNMPSAREPNPPSMTPRQIADFQQACNRFYRYDNNMIHPSRVPSPRPRTPEGPSTPPRRLSKIREALLHNMDPLDRGRRKERPPGNRHSPSPQGSPREWRHNSAPSASRSQQGWREQTNKYFLGGPGYGREERIPPPRKRGQRYPPGPDRNAPTGQSSHRGPQQTPYRGHQGPSMPIYPQEVHTSFPSPGSIGRQNFNHFQDRSFSRDLYLEPQTHSRQTLQVGSSEGDELLATITTTTTTSTVTPVRLSASDVENFFTPTEISTQKSSSEQSHGVSRESIATTTTKAGSVVNAENAENTGSTKQTTAIHVIKLEQPGQGVDGLIHASGIQVSESERADNENSMKRSPVMPLTKWAYYSLLPMAVFYLTLMTMTYREYREYWTTGIPGLKLPQGLRSKKIVIGVLFVAVAVSITFRG